MPLPEKHVSFSVPGNLYANLRREAARLDRSADAVLMEHVVNWLKSLPDADGPAVSMESPARPKRRPITYF